MSDQNGQGTWRDRLFGGSSAGDQNEAPEAVEETQAPEAPEAVETPAAVEEPEAIETPEATEAPEQEAPAEVDDVSEQRAWQAAFDGDDKEPTAEYRPSPSTPAPDAEVEPQVVPPSTLRGANPTGEMDAVESPELVEPARPQLSLRRRERAIADAREAEAALAEDPAEAAEPVNEPAAAEPVAEDPVVAESEDTATTAIPAQAEAEGQQTRVLETQDHRPDPAEEPTVVAPVVAPTPRQEPVAAEQAAREDQVDDILFVEQPEEPRKRGARGVGFVVVLLSTLVFGGLFGLAMVGADYLFNAQFDAGMLLTVWLTSEWLFAVVAFFVSYWLLTLIVNRAGWWAHVLGGFIVALITYAAFIFASNFEHNGGWADLGNFFVFTRDGIVPHLLSAAAVLAFVLAREVPIWLGGIVSKRGRKQRERYNAELEEYRRQTETDTASV